MKNLLYIFLIGIISACETQSSSEKNDKDNHPNIIIVLADDMGYGDVSLYNPEGKIKTPNIDKIGEQGMIFTDAHTSSSVCTPTRYSLLTGRYNWRSRLKSGVLTGKSKALINSSRTTLASMLKKQNYQTAFIGKWHLGWDWTLKSENDTTGDGWNKGDFYNIDFSKPIKNGPESLGFDYSYGHAASLDIAPYVYVENGSITAQPNRVSVDTGKYSWWREGPTGSDFVHEEVTPNFFERSIQFVKEKAANEEPYFLYLALPSPHTPILPTEKYQGKSGFNDYADFIMMIDEYLGILQEAIRSTGEEDNTLLVFTTDNGCSPASGFDLMVEEGHLPNYIFRGHKADIYEGGHRIPFLAKWPAGIKAGTRSDETISSIDFMATFAEMTGIELNDNEGEDSYSILSLFSEPSPETPVREATVHHSIDGDFAIRQGDWKLILTKGSGGWSFPRKRRDQAVLDTLPPYQLYNLKSDPGEKTNLLNEHPEITQELTALLIKYIEEGRSTPGVPQSNDEYEGTWGRDLF